MINNEIHHPNESSPFPQKIAEHEKNAFFSRKLFALEATTKLEVAITGSVAWALQTGIPPEKALEYASDVDVAMYQRDDELIDAIYAGSLEDVEVKSDGWESRITQQNVQIDGKDLSLSLVDYHDIALTMCAHLTTERRFRFFQPHIIKKTMRTLQALVHMHNFAAQHDIDGNRSADFQKKVKNAIDEVGNLIQSMEFEGNEFVSKENLRQLSIDAFRQIRAQLVEKT